MCQIVSSQLARSRESSGAQSAPEDSNVYTFIYVVNGVARAMSQIQCLGRCDLHRRISFMLARDNPMDSLSYRRLLEFAPLDLDVILTVFGLETDSCAVDDMWCGVFFFACFSWLSFLCPHKILYVRSVVR